MHGRRVERLLRRFPDSLPLIVLCGNFYFFTGSYRYALGVCVCESVCVCVCWQLPVVWLGSKSGLLVRVMHLGATVTCVLGLSGAAFVVLSILAGFSRPPTP